MGSDANAFVRGFNVSGKGSTTHGMKKPKPKKGRVVRLTPDLVRLIAEERVEGESVPDTIRRLLNLTGTLKYVLPSDLHETIEDARGIAVLRALRTRRPERPMKVRKVE